MKAISQGNQFYDTKPFMLKIVICGAESLRTTTTPDLSMSLAPYDKEALAAEPTHTTIDNENSSKD